MIYGAGTALVFVVALLLPLAFRGGSGAGAASLNAGERAAIFAGYWNSGEGTAQELGSPGRKVVKYCAGRMEAIVAACSVDKRTAEAEAEGSEYLLVSSAQGGIRVCRKWLKYQGDWSNWLDVCFDMDTGEIYYLYVSSQCVASPDLYADVFPGGLNASVAAKKAADFMGCDLLHLDWDGSAADPASAIFASDGSAVRMEISCIYYESTIIDVRMTCS